ncbi:MAG: ShlB/FhaC/HecB family hemolysin secretion/activation protein, partial [Caulobacterales bacterium]
ASVDASVNGYLRGGDKLSLAYTAPLEDDLFRYFGLNYTTPVGTDGLTASFNVSALETHPAEAPIEGNSEAASVAFSYPLLRSFTESTIVSFGFDALNNQNSVFGQSIDTSRTRVFRGALSHALTNENSFSSLAISASLGVDALGAEVNELYADADFFKLSAQGAWIYGFENRTVLRLRGQAQISGDQLPPSEQFALGGDLYGRAFASGLIQGDKGIAGSLEAAYRPELSFAPFLAGSEIYAFTDAGTVWTADRSTFEGGDASLSSFGAGARFLIANSVSIGLEASRPIDAPSADREEDDWRFLYSLRATAP